MSEKQFNDLKKEISITLEKIKKINNSFIKVDVGTYSAGSVTATALVTTY